MQSYLTNSVQTLFNALTALFSLFLASQGKYSLYVTWYQVVSLPALFVAARNPLVRGVSERDGLLESQVPHPDVAGHRGGGGGVSGVQANLRDENLWRIFNLSSTISIFISLADRNG